MSNIWPVLYKKDKLGRIRSWSIWTYKDRVVTSFGLVDGGQQISEYIVTPKNIGKKNQTTLEEQAILEANSIFKAQQDKGYCESISSAQNYILLPMLAHSFEDKKKNIRYPVHLQPKLDGCRCLCYWEDNEVILLSRKGKLYNVPHLSEELKLILPKGRVFDGELYLHGATFQEVTRLIKKQRPESSQLEYWIYDSFEIGEEQEPWEERANYLINLYRIVNSDHIKIVYHNIAHDEQEVYKIQKDFVKDGFEGAIVRCLDGPYLLNHRSSKLLKVKSFLESEYKVVDAIDGIGKFKDCVTWICETENGSKFGVVPKGTIEDKKEWFKNKEKYIGKYLTIKYFELTEDNIPRFPVGLGFKEDR